MKNVFIVLIVLVCISCNSHNQKKEVVEERARVLDYEYTPLVKMDGDTLTDIGQEVDFREPTEADAFFADFLFNYASNKKVQGQRTKFPLPFSSIQGVDSIPMERFSFDSIFLSKDHYHLFFDTEDDMDIPTDSNMVEAYLKSILLDRDMETRYVYHKEDKRWLLTEIRKEKLTYNSNSFYSFYKNFITDSVFQVNHIKTPIEYITLDPDNEFDTLSSLLSIEQWNAFRPAMERDYIIMLDYGQTDYKHNRQKIVKISGIGNGFAQVLYFSKIKNQWMLTKFEDTSI